jgi:hypothetical protein
MTIEEQRKEFEAWWDMERARVQEGRHNTKEACLLAWQAARNQSNNVPVAWMNEKLCIIKSSTKALNEVELSDYNIPLYTSPQQSNALEMAAKVLDDWINTSKAYGFTGDAENYETIQSQIRALIPQPESTAPQTSQSEPVTSLEEWIVTNMPAGTVIGDPNWWARKINNVLGFLAARAISQSEPVGLQYATQLAIHLHKKFYKEKSPIFEPLDTVNGVLSQIDNMICGIAAPQQAIPSGWKLVPIEPTEDMEAYGNSKADEIAVRVNGTRFKLDMCTAYEVYKAMLNVAPIESGVRV